MSTGTLRRHYRQTEGAAPAAPSAPGPVAEKHDTGEAAALAAEVDRLTAALEATREQAASWKREAQALGWTKPEKPAESDNGEQAAPESTEAPQAPEAGAQGAEEGESTEEATATEDAAPEADELPSRAASTAEWIDYAERHPLDPALDLTPRAGLRDIIADAYAK